MHVQDIYEPFSADLVGKFDVVHIQKLITIVYNNDPAPLIQNVMGLLSTFFHPMERPLTPFSPFHPR